MSDLQPDQAERIQREIERLCNILEKHHSQITVTHTQASSIGGWQVAAVCACFFTMFALIIALIFAVPEVHDLRAWQDVLRQRVAKLEAQTPPKEKAPSQQ